MKLTAKVFGDVVHTEPTTRKADLNKVAHLVAPGAVISDINGNVFRVRAKVAGPEGYVFKLANLQGKPVQTPANFYPVNRYVAKVARWMRFVLAYNKDWDLYVKEYIKAAGLPVDESWNWAKWFQAKFVPSLHGDEEVRDEAVHQTIITSLAHRKILDPTNPSGFANAIKRFPPAVQALPLEKQVTQFLLTTFLGRKQEANLFIDKMQRPDEVGMFRDDESLDGKVRPGGQIQGPEGDYAENILDTEEHATPPAGQEEAEFKTDMDKFRRGLDSWLADRMRPESASNYLKLWDAFMEWVLAEHAEPKISDLYPLWAQRTVDAKHPKGLGFDSMKVYYQKFPELLRQFVQDNIDELGDSPLAAVVEKMPKAEGVGAAKGSSLGGLKIAEDVAPDVAQARSETESPNTVDADIAAGRNQAEPIEKNAGEEKKWTCPACNQTFTSQDSEALERRKYHHLDTKHDGREEWSLHPKASRKAVIAKIKAKKAGQWGERSWDSDQVHDVLDGHRPDKSQGFDSPVPPENIAACLADAALADDQVHLGVVVFLLEHGSEVPEQDVKKALRTARHDINDDDYINGWSDPNARAKRLSDEIYTLENAKSKTLHMDPDRAEDKPGFVASKHADDDEEQVYRELEEEGRQDRELHEEMNRCSCEWEKCPHCRGRGCKNQATHKVEIYGFKTRLCDDCLNAEQNAIGRDITVVSSDEGLRPQTADPSDHVNGGNPAMRNAAKSGLPGGKGTKQVWCKDCQEYTSADVEYRKTHDSVQCKKCGKTLWSWDKKKAATPGMGGPQGLQDQQNPNLNKYNKGVPKPVVPTTTLPNQPGVAVQPKDEEDDGMQKRTVPPELENPMLHMMSSSDATLKLAGANKEVVKKLRDAMVGDTISWSGKFQCYIVKRGYFYTHGMNEDKLAEAIKRIIPEAQITKTENHWHPWPKDSWWEVRFQVPEAAATETPKQEEVMAEPKAQGATASKRASVIAKIKARKSSVDPKWATLRRVADEHSPEAAEALDQLAAAFGELADRVDAFRENLDLVDAPKEAALKTRIAAKRELGNRFRRVAQEEPEQLQEAVNELYHSLNDVVNGVEAFADHLGIELSEPPVEEESEAAKEIFDEAIDEGETPEHELEEKAEGDVEEHEAASGSDAFVTDRDDSAQPRAPKQVEIPVAKGAQPPE